MLKEYAPSYAAIADLEQLHKSVVVPTTFSGFGPLILQKMIGFRGTVVKAIEREISCDGKFLVTVDIDLEKSEVIVYTPPSNQDWARRKVSAFLLTTEADLRAEHEEIPVATNSDTCA